MRTNIDTLIAALYRLTDEIESDDGVANNTVLEAAYLLDDCRSVARYWYEVSECDCHSDLPQGGCLKCDLEKLLKPNAKHS